MDFSLTDDQEMLRESVARVIKDEYDFERRQRDAASEAGFGQDFWLQGAELGWNAVPFSEEAGGFGGGPEEIAIVMEAMGHGLVPSPYWASSIFAGSILQRCAAGEAVINGLMDGSTIGTVAYAEPGTRYELLAPQTTATKDGDGWSLRGTKIAVPYLGQANWLVAPARMGDAGVGLFLVSSDAEGSTASDYATFDGQRAGNVEFSNCKLAESALLADPSEGAAILEAAAHEATLALAAEALGVVEFVTATTLDYTRNRKQFGKAIGSFQALQHRMVDMFITQTQLRSLLYRAIISAKEGADSAAKDLAALKYYLGEPVRKLGQEAVQLHGGMGVTWEMAVAHYFKRLTALDLLLGNADYQLGRFGALSHS